MSNPLFYRNYPANVSYNPYLNSSYQRSSPFEGIAMRPQQSPIADEASTREQARLLAERKARRAQYLPDEEEQDSDDGADFGYGGFGLRARRRQQLLERQRQEALGRQKQQQMAAAEKMKQRDNGHWRQQEIEREKEVLENRRREYEEALRKKREQEERRRQAKSEPPAATRTEAQTIEDKSVPIRYRSSPSPKATEQQQEPKTIYTEEHNEAASRIQQIYRIHKSFQALDEVKKEFHALKMNFVYPTVIDFQSEKGVISVSATHSPSDFAEPQEDGEPMDVDGPQGKLAYTSTNYGLLAYSDAMDKLLIKLDGVESFGEGSLRQRRRGIVKEIESESRRLGWYLEEGWRRYVTEKEAEEAGWDFVDSDKQ